ncbi:hypothetical protein EWM64_g4154 [Hericium alpestre]|uniref:non-specific serine/threonine protein kinase n=1 Tax=Hericium alpestre TaxID=135208 RepID=A0A4Z0A0J7_9AGAM|nr:hypothetical protein EWM64_g4154 [Hericium alpestre]
MAPSAASVQRGPSTSASRWVEDEEIKPYVFVGELGKGSFAIVYKGYHEGTRQEVAIKTVSRLNLSPKLFENLQSEIDILKSMSHRHITKLIDIIRAERNIYLIMEYCSGGDLAGYLKKRGRVETLEYVPSPGAAPQYYPHPRVGLAEIVVRSFLRQLARALKFLRQHHLIHRDIKPQNLLLKPASPEELRRGHPLGVPILKVADFGFARILPNASMAETLCGSPLYMAPEILMHQKYDAKADLWSVGAVLYEMSVGRPPYRAGNPLDLLRKIDQSRGVRFPDEDPTTSTSTQPVPEDIKILVRMLLRKTPAQRASFEEFFKSTAMANSKFPRPREQGQPEGEAEAEAEGDGGDAGEMPEHHIHVPPEVLDMGAMIPPSKFHFRRREETGQTDAPAPPLALPTPTRDAPPPPVPATMLATPPTGKTQRPTLPSPAHAKTSPNIPRNVTAPPFAHRPLSTEGSIIPGETEEDGLLRREYVLVGDTQAVEFNRTVDEINAARRRPLLDRRVPPLSVDTNMPKRSNSRTSTTSAPPQAISPSPSGMTPPTFPPPPNPSAPATTPPTPSRASSLSNPLARAINIASRKLFGSASPSPSGGGIVGRSPPSRAPSPLPSPRILSTEERDPVEDVFFEGLEQLAQKTDVITRWADEMYEYVKAVPQKPLPDPAKFAPREGEPEKLARRRQHADVEAEYNAVTCVAIYMLVMSFAQKGIEELRRFQEHTEMRNPGGFVMSRGFDDALSWFKDHFITCNDRAALVKTWLPAQYTGPSTWVDELVYNRALTLSRNAARKELLDQHKSPDECEKLYEESLWCLYALQDDLLQKGNPFMEEDRETIATWIKRTKLRLVRCRARMGMPNRERLRDARADKNLDDVPRIPAPWDAEGMAQLRTQSQDGRS